MKNDLFGETIKMSQVAVNYSFVFDFERNFDCEQKTSWMKDNYRVPIYTSVCYLAAILLLKGYMKSRPAFDLRMPLGVWNISLSIFSMLGTIRCIPVLLFDLSNFGFHHSVCDSSNFISTSVFWAWLFTMSKFTELGDTLFIVLRKQKLIFLHWYHHVTVLISCWFAFSELSAPARWYVTMNYVVHFLMYTYYASRAFRIKLPKWVSMTVTVLQIAQMFAGFYICVYIFWSRIRGISCDVSGNVANLFLFIYSTYFLLFVNFFYKTYLRSATHKPQKML